MCGCRKNRVADGTRILGFEVTLPNGAVMPSLFLTVAEARAEVRRAGGGTIRQKTKPQTT